MSHLNAKSSPERLIKETFSQGLLIRIACIKALSIMLDAAIVLLAYGIASYTVIGREVWHGYFTGRLGPIYTVTLVTVGTFYVFDIYPNYRKFTSFSGVMLLWDALVYTFFIQGLIFYFAGSIETIGRGIFVISVFLQVGFFTLFKALTSLLVNRLGHNERALIIEYNPQKEFYFNFLREAEKKKRLPFEIIGIVSDEGSELSKEHSFDFLGQHKDLESIIEKYRVNTLILTSSYGGKESLQEFLIMAHHNHSQLVSLETLYEEIAKKVPYELVNKTELLNECLLANRFAHLKKKRVLDVLLSLGLIIFLLPIGLLIALAIKLTSKGRILYIQERVGFRGQNFKMLKFRTMREDAEHDMGPVFTAENDPRMTKTGKFLRKTHLDELPQLINVLKGEMSIVGPRPEREEFIQKVEKRIPLYALRLFTRPGITGWAQITQGYAASFKDLEEKFRYDLYYLKRMTISLDIKIILLTLQHLFLASGR